jgi:hypothetical protein
MPRIGLRDYRAPFTREDIEGVRQYIAKAISGGGLFGPVAYRRDMLGRAAKIVVEENGGQTATSHYLLARANAPLNSVQAPGKERLAEALRTIGEALEKHVGDGQKTMDNSVSARVDRRNSPAMRIRRNNEST